MLSNTILTEQVTSNIQFSECLDNLDLGFVVDGSGSITENGNDQNWPLVLDFVVRTMRYIRMGNEYSRVGAVLYSQNAELMIDIEDEEAYDKNLAMADVTDWNHPWSRTNTSGGLYSAIVNLYDPDIDRAGYTNLLMLLTDGMSNVDGEYIIPYSDELKNDLDTRIIVIAVTDAVNYTEVNAIASLRSDGTPWVINVTDFGELQSELENIAVELCEEGAQFEPTPAPTPAEGSF